MLKEFSFLVNSNHLTHDQLPGCYTNNANVVGDGQPTIDTVLFGYLCCTANHLELLHHHLGFHRFHG